MSNLRIMKCQSTCGIVSAFWFIYELLTLVSFSCECRASLYDDTDPAHRQHRKPTEALKHAIEFYNATMSLQERVELLSQTDPYGDIMSKEMKSLQGKTNQVITTITQFKSQWEPSQSEQMRQFIQAMSREQNEIKVMSQRTIPMHKKALEKMENAKTQLLEEVHRFLLGKAHFEEDVHELDAVGIVLHSLPVDVSPPEFDRGALNEFLQAFLDLESKEKELNAHQHRTNNVWDHETNAHYTAPLKREVEHLQASRIPQLIERHGLMLRQFVTVVNRATEEIQVVMEDVADKYDKILNRMLEAAQEVARDERRIHALLGDLHRMAGIKDEL